MIKIIAEQHTGNLIPMVYCDFCGEGMSNRPEDDKAAKKFKAEHKRCKKYKNNKIDLKHLPDAPV